MYGELFEVCTIAERIDPAQADRRVAGDENDERGAELFGSARTGKGAVIEGCEHGVGGGFDRWE
jgi:hypothetical protein